MKNKKIIMMLVIMAMCLVAGCGSSKKNGNKDNTVSHKEEMLYIVPCRYDMVLGDGICTSPHFEVKFISKKELDLSKVRVRVGTDLSYQTEVVKVENGQIPEHIKKMYENEGKDTAVFKDKKQSFYTYKVAVMLELCESDISIGSEVSNLIITYDGVDYKTNINDISIQSSIERPTNEEQSSDMYFEAVSTGDINIVPNKKGEMDIAVGLGFVVNNDVILKNVKIQNNDTKIKQVIVHDKTNEREITLGKNLEIGKGTQGSLQIILEDEDFEKELMYSSYIHVCMEYEIDGRMYNAQTELQLSTLLSPYEMYAACVDELDVLGYYER